jgi:hypothetical protein
MWEVEAALKMNKRVVPVVSRRVREEVLPNSLRQYNLFYLDDENDRDAYETLTSALIAASDAPTPPSGAKSQ